MGLELLLLECNQPVVYLLTIFRARINPTLVLVNYH